MDNLVIPAIYDRIESAYENLIIVKKSEKYGVIDMKGKIIIPIKYDIIQQDTEWIDGKEIIAKPMSFIVEKGKKKGLVNNYGKIVAPIIYDEILNISKHLSILLLNNKYGLIDRVTGNFLVDFKYDFIYPNISENVILVSNNDKNGFIDIHGNVIIPLVYENLTRYGFSEGLAGVYHNSKVFFINNKNEVVLEPVAPVSLK